MQIVPNVKKNNSDTIRVSVPVTTIIILREASTVAPVAVNGW